MLLSLIRKIAAYDEEIQHLYEEMEQQIKKEKEQFLLKVSVSLLLWAWILLPLPVVLYSFWVWNESPQNVFHNRIRKNIIYLTATFVLIQALQLQTKWLVGWEDHQCPVLSGWHTVAAGILLKVNWTTASLYYRCCYRYNFWSQLGKMLFEVVQSSTNPVEFCSLCFWRGDKFSLKSNKR